MAELRSELTGNWTWLESKRTGDMAELHHDLISDMPRLDNTMETRFERRFSDLKASTNRSIALSMAGNTVVVDTAWVV